MEYLKNLNEKAPDIGGSSKHDNCVKEMYSCGRKEEGTVLSNVIALVSVIGLFSFLVYRYVDKPAGSLHFTRIFDFAADQQIFKMFIGLMILINLKTLSNSLIANIILPLMRPILPLLSSSLKFKFGLFSVNIGDFISDLLVFAINMYLIYFMFAWI